MKLYNVLYEVNKNLNDSDLIKNGFKNNIFKCFVYKDMVQLIIKINTKNFSWDYLIFDIDSNSIYKPYYDNCNRENQRSEVVIEIDKKVDFIMNKMIETGILK